MLTGRARRLFRGRGAVKAIVRSMAEHKFYDFYQLFAPPTTLPAPLPVTTGGVIWSPTAQILQGGTQNTRIGDKISWTSLEVKFASYSPKVIVAGATESNTMWILRILIFVWKDDTEPFMGDLFDIPPTVLTGSNLPYCWGLDHDKKVKRKLLYDRTFTQWCDSSASVGSFTGCDKPVVSRRIFIPCKKLGNLGTVNYVNGTQAAINHVYFIAVSNVLQSNAEKVWNLDISCRVNYIDM